MSPNWNSSDSLPLTRVPSPVAATTPFQAPPHASGARPATQVVNASSASSHSGLTVRMKSRRGWHASAGPPQPGVRASTAQKSPLGAPRQPPTLSASAEAVTRANAGARDRSDTEGKL